MPDTGTRERSAIQTTARPIPIVARQRLWDALWERLLAPPAVSDAADSEQTRTGGGQPPALPAAIAGSAAETLSAHEQGHGVGETDVDAQPPIGVS